MPLDVEIACFAPVKSWRIFSNSETYSPTVDTYVESMQSLSNSFSLEINLGSCSETISLVDVV